MRQLISGILNYFPHFFAIIGFIIVEASLV